MDRQPKKQNSAKEILSAYRDACMRRDSLIRQTERLYEDATRITQTLSPVISHGTKEPDRMASIVCSLIETYIELALEAENAKLAAEKAMAIIAAMEEPTHRTVLHLRYIDGLGWETIAKKMNYDRRWVMRLHGRALQAANCWLNEREKTDKKQAVD